MTKTNLLVCVVLLVSPPLLAADTSSGVVPKMTPEMVTEATRVAQGTSALTSAQIEEAIRFGNSQKPEFAPVQMNSKWAVGEPAIGFASTPFLRVARLAASAKQKYRQVVAADLPSGDLLPELHIYVGSRPVHPATNSFDRANVVAIVFTPRIGSDEEKRAKAIQPLRSSDLEERFQNLFGAEGTATGMMAAFPLDIVDKDLELHVVFDNNVKMVGVVTCSDCKARIDGKKLR